MGHFVSPSGRYYEGDKADQADLPVARRPKRSAVFTAGSWVDTPDPAPDVVEAHQFRLALRQFGLLSQANTAVTQIPGQAGAAAAIEWEYRSAVDRRAPLMQTIISGLGLTQQQVDDLFRLAATF